MKHLKLILALLGAMLLTTAGISAGEKKVYTVFDESTGTLTYYYDDQMDSRSGILEEYDPKISEHFRSYDTGKITKAVVDKSMKEAPLTNMTRLFSSGRPKNRLNALTSIEGLENLNTADVTTMSSMFSGCSALTSLDLSSFNTDNVENMSYMFEGCSSLTSLNISSFNTSKVCWMEGMFYGCSSLTSLNLSNFNTEKVKDMGRMFQECSSLASLDLSSFNTIMVEKMVYMFSGCKSLKSLNLNSFNTIFVTSMAYMFAGCSSLTSLDLSSFNTANVTTMVNMFYNCESLTKIDFSSFNTIRLDDMSHMFEGCSALTSLDLRNFTVDRLIQVYSMFTNCSHLTTIFCNHNWRRFVYNSDEMFKGCNKLVGGKGSTCDGENHIDKSYARPDGGPGHLGYFTYKVPKRVYTEFVESTGTLTYYYDDQMNSRTGIVEEYNPYDYKIRTHHFSSYAKKIVKAVIDPSMKDAKLTSTYYMFRAGSFDRLYALTSIERLDNLNTEYVTDMSYMFNCNLASLDVSHFNTSKVTNMESMFYECLKLTSLDLSSFNTEKVANMSNMFYYCYTLKDLDLSSFNTANVEYMEGMFSNCSSLTSLDLRNFNTEKVTKMNGMFSNCSSLTSLDLSSFNTANVTEMTNMFYKCKKLTSLDVSSFNTANVNFMPGMFQDCYSLESIDVSGFNTSQVKQMNSMFSNCRSLITLDVSHFNTSNVKFMDRMFELCNSLTSLDVSNFDINKVERMPWMFAYCDNLTSIYGNNDWSKSGVLKDGGMFAGCVKLRGGKGTVYNTSNIDRNYARPDAGRGAPGYFTKREAGKFVYSVFDEKTGTLTYYYDDKRFDEKERPGIKEEFDPSSAYMVRFEGYNDKVLAVRIDPSMKEAQLLSTSGMFGDLNHAKTIEGMENLNTAKVQDMSYMFYDCRALKELDLSACNTANVTNMSQMFYGCHTLKDLDLSSFNTANVTDMKNMFNGCRFLNNVNLLSFNTEKVTDMAGMFASCFSLKEIDLGSFQFAQLKDASSMFAQCGALTTIICSDDWSSNAALLEDGQLFSGCGSLKGSKGTICDGEKNIDKSYARPDGGTERPGYFTPLTEEAIIDGINYLLNNRDHTATVLPLPEGKYEGNLLIPEKVTYYSKEYTVVGIGDNAFKECYDLISLTMESANPPKVGKDAFEGVTDILSVHVPDESKWLYENADGWKDIDEIHISSHVIDGICYELDPNTYFAKVIGLPNGKYKGNIIVPQEIVYEGIKYKVGSIGKYAFARCPELISVSLPSTITDIADFAFLGSPALTTINISDDNKTYCDIEGIVYSKNKKTLLFYPNGRYGGYEVPEGTLRIEHNVFNGTDLRWMILPESLKEIGSFALDQTNLVWLVSKSTSPAVAEELAFYSLNKQISVYVPEESLEAYQTADEWKEFTNIISGIKRHVQVGDFYYDLYLWNKYADVVGAVNEPSGTLVLLSEIDVDVNTLYGISGSGDENDLVHFTVTGIGKEAFKLDQMNEVIIPGTITSIGMHAFYGCTSLMNVELSEGLEEIKAFAFAKCQKMASIKLPESLVTIGQDALAACGFADVTIPDKVKTIGGYAFEDCKNLKWVEIGTSVRHIGNCAFKNANQLLGVFANGETAPLLGENVFLNCSNLKQVYVPCGALDHYRRVWKQYFQLILNDPISYYYTITATPSEHGTVEVPISDCDHNLTAIPDEGYQFVKWTDGNTDNPRFVETPKENLVFEAVFEPKNYRWLVESSNDEWGYVSSPKTLDRYPYNTEMIAIAVPKDGYKFIKWNDGYMNTPYNFNLTKDTYLRAIFIPENEEPEIPQFTMQVTAAKIRWWKKDEAFLYSLDIYMDEECTQLFASYLFDKNGYIVAVSLAPKAPSRNWKEEQETEFQYNITGLTADTKYYYRMKTTDEEGKLIYTDEGDFRTLNSAVYVVIQHIDAIGEVTYTSECGTNIELAREAYDALSEENKALVTNYATLIAAEETFAQLKAAAEAAELAKAKEELAAILVDLQTLKLFADEQQATTASSILGNAITAANAVLNSTTVTTNEVEKATMDAYLILLEAQEILLMEAKNQMKDALDALLLPDDSEECQQIIADAKEQIDALDWDNSASLADNISALTINGAAIYDKAKADLEAQRQTDHPTGLDEVQSHDIPCTKVLRNGILYIQRGDQLYDLMGRRVQ